jgi:hypothetical protein
MALENTFYRLQDIGVFDVFLPFILIFVLVFGIMQKVKLFGDPTKDPKLRTYNSMIALVMALIVVMPHVLWGNGNPSDPYLANGMIDVIKVINTSIPNVSVVLVAILMALLIIGLLGKRFELAGGTLSGWIAIAAFAVIVYIFGDAANWWVAPRWMWFINDPDLIALVLVILVFAIIIWFITKEDGKPGFWDKNKAEIGEMLRDPNK